jgi:hypothetical protein
MADTTANIASETSRTLRARLAGGTVKFTFLKLDGSTREATGTTDLSLVPLAFRPTTDGRKPADLIVYFDLGVVAWRSCKADRVVSIDD